MDYEVYATSLIVKPKGEPIYSERATVVAMTDDGAGPFVVVSQEGRDLGKIAIDPTEWPVLRQAVDDMMALCGNAVASES